MGKKENARKEEMGCERKKRRRRMRWDRKERGDENGREKKKEAKKDEMGWERKRR